jgi:8-oxo-dGTP pyrophosphatase MutT (NUDIX family)
MKTILKKIRNLKSNIKKGWYAIIDDKKIQAQEMILENPNFCRFEIVANIRDKNDQSIIIEPSGSVAVILIDEKNRIYLHSEYRPAIQREKNFKIKKGNLNLDNFEKLGRNSIEIIRGYGEGNWETTAIQEVEEEAGFTIKRKDLEYLAEINWNTAKNISNTTVVLAKKDSKIKIKKISEYERRKIKKGKWYKIDDVCKMIQKNKIICANTLAALNIYFQKYNNKN